MIYCVELSNTSSLKSDVIPLVTHDLETRGFSVVRVPPSAHLISDLLVVSALVGCEIGTSFAYHLIEGESESAHLAAHTEGISYSCGIIPYFSLGCINPADVDGGTRIFDGRKAAALAEEKGVDDVVIEYGSFAHPDQVAKYPIVVTDPIYGRVLRYRGKVLTNKLLDQGLDENHFYGVMDSILEQSLLCTHIWNVGDLMFVNNKFTLHDRLPYQGRRSMLRVRYDDGLHTNFRF